MAADSSIVHDDSAPSVPAALPQSGFDITIETNGRVTSKRIVQKPVVRVPHATPVVPTTSLPKPIMATVGQAGLRVGRSEASSGPATAEKSRLGLRTGPEAVSELRNGLKTKPKPEPESGPGPGPGPKSSTSTKLRALLGSKRYDSETESEGESLGSQDSEASNEDDDVADSDDEAFIDTQGDQGFNREAVRGLISRTLAR